MRNLFQLLWSYIIIPKPHLSLKLKNRHWSWSCDINGKWKTNSPLRASCYRIGWFRSHCELLSLILSLFMEKHTILSWWKLCAFHYNSWITYEGNKIWHNGAPKTRFKEWRHQISNWIWQSKKHRWKVYRWTEWNLLEISNLRWNHL